MIIHKGTVDLETKRLLLRRFTINDASAAYSNWFSDPDVAMYMRWDAHTSINQTQEFLMEFIRDYEKPDFYRWAITLKPNDIAIGAIGFYVDSEFDSLADVSYSVGREFWDKGIASEALERIIKYALTEVGLNRIEAFHAVNNPASGKVMQKAGMQYEGHSRQKYKSHKGFEDCDLYAALRDDFMGK